MSVLLRMQQASFAYANRPVFDSISFDLHQGECTALIGPNGAGKTTLLRMISGMARPSSGEVLFEGKPISSFSKKILAQRVALVPQQIEVPFAFTVEQIVEQGRNPYLSLLGGLRQPDRDAVERAIDLADLRGLRRRIFNQLSGGEKQRVKIALGLAQEPKLLLLDEPTQNLDIGRQVELIDLVRSLQHEGITVLASMHDLQLIPGTFSSVLLLNPEGRLQTGTPEQILRHELLEKAFHYSAEQYPFLTTQGRMV